MTITWKTLLTVSALLLVLLGANVLRAHEQADTRGHGSTLMGDRAAGMMGMLSMMGRMSGMMGACNSMMAGMGHDREGGPEQPEHAPE